MDHGVHPRTSATGNNDADVHGVRGIVKIFTRACPQKGRRQSIEQLQKEFEEVPISCYKFSRSMGHESTNAVLVGIPVMRGVEALNLCWQLVQVPEKHLSFGSEVESKLLLIKA